MTTRPRVQIADDVRTEVLAAQMCRYCGDLNGPYEVDHVIPISRGGTNAIENLACACVSCNTQKRSHLLHEWIQWRKANGMSWPPVASHATDPVHYKDNCEPCFRGAAASDDNGHIELMLAAIQAPIRLDRKDDRAGYVGLYVCAACGHTWRCWWAHDVGYFSDCSCEFCVTSRLEVSA